MIYLGIDSDRNPSYIPCVKADTGVLVNYYGEDILVEPWATHIATDKDGKVHCYDFKPVLVKSEKQWVMDSKGFLVRYCGEVDLEGENWTKTCQEVVK